MVVHPLFFLQTPGFITEISGIFVPTVSECNDQTFNVEDLKLDPQKIRPCVGIQQRSYDFSKIQPFRVVLG